MSYRNPRFSVSLLFTFQSSLKYHPKYFLLNAAFALRLIPDAPPPLNCLPFQVEMMRSHIHYC